MKSIQLIALMLIALFLNSCNTNDDDIVYTDLPLGAYEDGVLVLNEGNFGTDNSTLSFISNDFSIHQLDAYGAVNGGSLGNTGQSVNFYDEMGFAVINGSNKIVVFNRYTLQNITTIETSLSNPRYIDFDANGKAYVTNWGDASIATDDYVAVFDLTSFALETTISVSEGPEKLLIKDNNLYVLHQGGYNFGNSVSVINTQTNALDSIITVGDVPNGIVVENNELYVLCGGVPSWATSMGFTETGGKLVKVNTNDASVTDVITFATTEHPGNLALENSVAYYTLNSVVYKNDIGTSIALSTTLIDLATYQGSSYDYAYGFAVNNNKIYVGDAKDFSGNGKVYIYSIDGILENEFEVKTSPNGFYFND